MFHFKKYSGIIGHFREKTKEDFDLLSIIHADLINLATAKVVIDNSSEIVNASTIGELELNIGKLELKFPNTAIRSYRINRH